MSKPARTAVLVALCATALYAALVGSVLASGGRADRFIAFGGTTHYPAFARPLLGDDLEVRPDDGHDGQAFWLQARDPFLVDGSTMVGVFDWPAYRAQRVFYPILAAPFRLGGEWSLANGLILVNLLAIFAGTFWTVRLGQHLGIGAKAAWAFALNPLLLPSILLDLSDVVATALVVATVLALRRRRFAWAIAAALALVLTRELLIVCLLGVALFDRDLPRRVRIALVAVPGAVAASWALYVRWRLGWPPSPMHGVEKIPFKGFTDSLHFSWQPRGNWEDAIAAGLLVAGAVWLVLRWWKRRTVELDAALPLAVLIPIMNAEVIHLAVNFGRAVGPAITLAAIDVLAGRRRVSPPTDRSRPARNDRSADDEPRTPPDRAGSAAG